MSRAFDSDRPRFRSTTVLGWVHGGVAALGADGQVTMGDVVVKTKARKIRRLGEGHVLAGFAGAAGDALALLDRLEEQVKRHPGQLERACAPPSACPIARRRMHCAIHSPRIC